MNDSPRPGGPTPEDGPGDQLGTHHGEPGSAREERRRRVTDGRRAGWREAAGADAPGAATHEAPGADAPGATKEATGLPERIRWAGETQPPDQDYSTAALPYTHEVDPLAEYWESPSAPVTLPVDDATSADGLGRVIPGSVAQEGTHQPAGWANGRIVAAFGLAVVIVAVTSLSLAWIWEGDGSTSARAQPQSAGKETESDKRGRAHQDTQPTRAQARAIDALLRGSTSARDEVVAAVVHTRKCTRIGKNIRDLRAAARQREQLVRRVRSLDAGAIPNGKEVTASLRRAWNKSAEADRAFAAWAQRVGSPRGCPGGAPVKGRHYQRAVQASAAASQAKARFVRLWNPIAVEAGLPKRSEDGI